MSRVAELRSVLADIRLSHSVFALPFAAIGLAIGTRGRPPGWELAGLVLLAMVLARSAAMAFNRLADHRFDATNPRTRGRALPAGRVRRGTMLAFLVACSAGFVLVASRFGTACLLLSPVVLAALFGYSLTKRFTMLAHAFVGFALALSPPAAYLAARALLEGREHARVVLRRREHLVAGPQIDAELERLQALRRVARERDLLGVDAPVSRDALAHLLAPGL